MKEAIFRFLHFIAYANEPDGIEGMRFYIFLFLCAAGWLSLPGGKRGTWDGFLPRSRLSAACISFCGAAI